MVIFNGKALGITHFSNSECRIKDFYYDITNENVVELVFETEKTEYKVNEDLMNLLFVAIELRKKDQKATLILWCMPYQRMDRKCEGDVFTLEAICEYINWLNFREVIVIEPHSDVTLKLLKNSKAIYPLTMWLPKIKEQIGFSAQDFIVFPDKGAAKRYKKYDLGANICYCEKKRNKISNIIEDSKIIDGAVKKGSKCIIIDDICSKGDTLVECCRLLKSIGVNEVYVIVIHCEATALSSPIFSESSLVQRFFTSKSNMSERHPKIEYLNINI